MPTFDTLKKPIEASLKRPVSELDFAKIVALLPRDCTFKYIDENQIITETKVFDFNNGGFQQKENDIYELKDVENEFADAPSTQILLFEFVDGVMSYSWTSGNKNTRVRLPDYTTEEMKKMISKRKAAFEYTVDSFIENCKLQGLEPMKELTSMATALLPKKKDYEDPIEAMMNSKDKKNDSEKVIIDEETGLERPTIEGMLKDLQSSEMYNHQIKEHFIIPEKPQDMQIWTLNWHLRCTRLWSTNGFMSIRQMQLTQYIMARIQS